MGSARIDVEPACHCRIDDLVRHGCAFPR
jgi:hypothetical protein